MFSVAYKYSLLISRNYNVIVVALVMCAALMGYWAYSTNVATQYKEVSTPVPFYTLRGGYACTAVVTEANPLWPIGTRLEGEAVYFLSASPKIDSTFQFQVAGDAVDLAATATSILIYGTKESNTTFWTKERLVSQKEVTLTGGTFVETISTDVGLVRQEIEQIQKGLDFQQGTPSIELVTTIHYQGLVDGTAVDADRVYVLPIEIGKGSYKVEAVPPSDEVVKRAVKSTVRADPPFAMQVASVLAFVAAVGMVLATVVVKTFVKPLTEEEAAMRAEKEVSDKYREYISSGRYKQAIAANTIDIGSLEDLILAAVDMNERVIFDSNVGIYFFIHGTVVYKYSKPEVRKPSSLFKESRAT